MTNRILVTYQNVSDPGLREMVLHIVTCMTNNEHFPNPTPSIDYLRSELTRFQELRYYRSSTDKKIEYEREKQSKYLRDLLHELAAYITREAKENRTKLLSSGFDINKERASRTTDHIKIETGKKRGEVTSTMYSVRGARAYIHQYSLGCPKEESDWQEEVSTSRKHVIKGLIPGKEYWFRAKALCLRNKQVVTGVVVIIVQ